MTNFQLKKSLMDEEAKREELAIAVKENEAQEQPVKSTWLQRLA